MVTWRTLRGRRKEEKNHIEHISHLYYWWNLTSAGRWRVNLKGKWQSRWLDISSTFTSFTFAALSCSCSIKWGGYRCTWLSALFQLSHSHPSAPETHYCSFCLIINWNTCPGFCLALTGWDQMIKYDLSLTVQESRVLFRLSDSTYYSKSFSASASKFAICCPLFFPATIQTE